MRSKTSWIMSMAIIWMAFVSVPASANISQLFAMLSVPKISAQTVDQAETQSLKLAYTEVGVASGIYQQISLDSNTNSLSLTNISSAATAETSSQKTRISSSQGMSQSQSNKILSDEDRANLRETIMNNGFFETSSMYPPNPSGPQDYTLSALSITLDDKPHTVLWTSTSTNVPAGLLSIANVIEDITQ